MANEPVQARHKSRDLALAIATPLALLLVVYVLSVVINKAVTIGPFDRATLGWATVMPLWFASPAISALLWRRLAPLPERLIAVVVGSVLGVAAAWLLWAAVVSENAACEFGPRSSPAEFLWPAALIGVLVGGGWAASSLVASSLARADRPWLGLAASVVVGFLQLGLVAVTFWFVAFAYAGCNRPGTG